MPVGRHLSHHAVVYVRDKQIAAGIDSESVWCIELRRHGWPIH